MYSASDFQADGKHRCTGSRYSVDCGCISNMDNTTEGKWDSLPVKLNDGITQTLNELGFTHMTPVQVLTFLYSFRLLHSHAIASYANKLDNVSSSNSTSTII